MLVGRVHRQRTYLERGYRPQPPQPNDTSGDNDNNTIQRLPDEQCLFDPSLPHYAADPEGDALKASFLNYRDQYVPIHSRCPEGYHSHEDDERGKCITDSRRRDEGYIMNPSFPPCDTKEFVENFQE